MPAEWICCRIQVPEDQQESLLAYLMAYGFEGFEQRPDCLLAYARSDQLTSMPPSQIGGYPTIVEHIAACNWNALWEKSYHPVRIGNLSIRAPHHAPDREADLELVIEPAMAFGTGHHETTRLCLQCLQQMDLNGKQVIDFGCGTGILSIYAAKQGASVVAIDSDPTAVECAVVNCKINGVLHLVDVRLAETVPENFFVDVVVANIDRLTLMQNMDRLIFALRPEGVLLLSGFFKKEGADFHRIAALAGLKLICEKTDAEWAALGFLKSLRLSNKS